MIESVDAVQTSVDEHGAIIALLVLISGPQTAALMLHPRFW